MSEFGKLFEQRSQRLLALSRLGRITLDALAFVDAAEVSIFDEHFEFMAKHIGEHYQNHPKINIPEYRVVAFVDGLTLIATISEIESYFQDLIASVVVRYPSKIGKFTLDLNTLQTFDSIPSAVEYAGRIYAASLMFEKPNTYKKKLLSILSAPDDLLQEHWPVFIESKARRDVGVHNNWFVNEIYKSKVREVGRSPVESGTLTVGTDYMNSVRHSCIQIMGVLAKHCHDKFA